MTKLLLPLTLSQATSLYNALLYYIQQREMNKLLPDNPFTDKEEREEFKQLEQELSNMLRGIEKPELLMGIINERKGFYPNVLT